MNEVVQEQTCKKREKRNQKPERKTIRVGGSVEVEKNYFTALANE
jgi:hypothetical protein